MVLRAIIGLCFLVAAANAQEGLWSLGLRTNGTIDFLPGNDYFMGVEIGYSNFNLGAHKLEFKCAYLTSRLEQVFRRNVKKQDYYLFSPLWHFRRNNLFDPILKADLGYTRFDIENEKIFRDLDHDSWVAALNVGLNLNLGQGETGLYYQVGYNLIQTSTLYPVVFGIGIWTML